ncbi:glycosyltransferase family 2 protein [Alphaproteobacteria bacterium]|nr:glycosyltransferase family 2 protein [Alphaproteobacteria bacterium]
MPKVSICILCHNAEDTIARAITSAASQDYKNTEIIVVDDASTDNSLRELAKLAQEYNIKLVKNQTNEGRGSSRNKAVHSATGEFIVFFDDDDVSTPQRITTQLRTILSFEKKMKTDKIACYASAERRYPNGYNLFTHAIGSTDAVPPHGSDMAKYLLSFYRHKSWYYGAGTPTSALMIRKSLVISAGGFDANLRYVEDVDLAIRLSLNGCYFIGSPIKLLVRNMSESADKSSRNNFCAERKLAIKYKKFLKEHRIFHHAYHWPELRFYHFQRKYHMFFLKLVILMIYNPLITIRHLLSTGPNRIKHELKIKM